ncbi:MAG: hypothetical protein IRZ16_13935 [Myxococcaceae bacterium]|nr:hypothetical protein [Myxococcaceae bacterium]
MQVLVPLLARPARRARGQTMVLAALSMFLLALMMILSFNVGHAVHEKIRLQQHSDAQAYSMAVLEARALNYFAVSNRAIAAELVSMNNLHAYMSLASLTGNYMRAGRINQLFIALEEFGQCGCWSCFMHCIHGIQSLGKMSTWSNAANKWDRRVKSLDSKFRSAVGTLDKLILATHAQQMLVYEQTVQALLNGTGTDLSKLKKNNAPRASDISAAVGGLNVNDFNCAIDGLPCLGGGPGNSSPQALSKVMTSVANASRNGWAANREDALIPLSPILPPLSPMYLMELMRMAGGTSFPIPGLYKGTAKTVNGGKGNVHGGNGDEGKSSSADDHGGLLFTTWKHGAMVWPVSDAYVYSDTRNGGHSPSGAHSGNHKFGGVNQKGFFSCALSGNCYMAFRADPDPKRDFGQPSVYSYITMPVRMGNVDKAPWELNSKAELKTEIGGDATIHLAAGDAAAVSKSMVYFHRMKSWKAPPNMFDPYWRAKLHPFEKTELLEVLGVSGNTDAAQLAATTNLPD